MKKYKKTIFFLILLLLFSIPSVIFLFNKGFFQSDDGEWMIIRFSAFHQALRDGQFPVRFLGRLNYGYGYPVANFLYPGFMYLAEPIHLIGFNFINTIKIVFGLSMLGSVVFTYFWLKKFFDEKSAFIGALFYLYTPYHLFDLYKRGSVGEILALSILPFILWQIERNSFFFSVLGVAFLIISHNTLSFLFMPIIFIYLFIKKQKATNKEKIYWYFGLPIIGIGLSSFFIIPAVFELSYVKFSSTQVSDITQYFSSVNLIGASSILILLITALLFYKIKPWLRSDFVNRLGIFMGVTALFSILVSLEVSLIVWNFIPSSLIQFPFRFLSFLPVSISFLAAYSISHIKVQKRIVIPILIFIIFASSFSYLKPSVFFDKGDSFYATNEGSTTVQDEYLPIWVKDQPREHFKNKVEVLGEGKIENLVYNSRKISFNIISQAGTKVRINTIYYPGWKVYLDKKEVNINNSNNKGLIEFFVKDDKSYVEVIFSETHLRLFSDILTVVSLIVLVILIR